jgi:hypothetical protein
MEDWIRERPRGDWEAALKAADSRGDRPLHLAGNEHINFVTATPS